MKQKYILLLAFLAIGCSAPKTHQQDIIGIDVSASFKDNMPEYEKSINHVFTLTQGEDLIVFVFADKSYEVYNGERPAKDRDISALKDEAIAEAETVEWKAGTDLIDMLEFLSKKIDSPSKLTLMTVARNKLYWSSYS
jgi:hypothetical protein